MKVINLFNGVSCLITSLIASLVAVEVIQIKVHTKEIKIEM